MWAFQDSTILSFCVSVCLCVCVSVNHFCSEIPFFNTFSIKLKLFQNCLRLFPSRLIKSQNSVKTEQKTVTRHFTSFSKVPQVYLKLPHSRLKTVFKTYSFFFLIVLDKNVFDYMRYKSHN